jgi:acyl-CoA thioesterase-1
VYFFKVNRSVKPYWLIIILIPMLLISDHLWAAQQRVLILGDSLSAAYGLKQEQGWVTLLQNAWQDKGIELINAAISGETSDGALARLPRLLEQHKPDQILVEIGGNDGLRGYPIDKMRNNIGNIIKLAKQQDVKVLLQQIRIPANYGRRYSDLFTDSYTLLAEQYNVPLIPFFMDDIALDDDLMQMDGIHPNLKAQPLIAASMQKQLELLILAE